MRHPHEKFIRLELLAILLAVIIGIIALLKGFLLVMVLTLYLITFSMIFGALVEWNTRQTNQAGVHFLQAALLFVFTTYLLFHI
jgi:hypothetical protein